MMVRQYRNHCWTVGDESSMFLLFEPKFVYNEVVPLILLNG